MLDVNETSPQPAKTHENASTPAPSPAISATKLVKLKIDKAILQQFQTTSSPCERSNDVGNRQSGDEEGFRQSNGMPRTEKYK